MTGGVEQAVAAAMPEAAGLLEELIAFESIEGNERPAQERLAEAFGDLGLDVALEPIDESIRSDPHFTPGKCASFAGRPNVVARLGGAGGGRSLIINTHIDVVPAWDWAGAFRPSRDGDIVRGRGAVDAKGQVAAAYCAIRALRELGIRPAGDVEVQVVIDEEVGGNGSLALLGAGHTADAAVVLEPTSLKMHQANRGALWFRFTLEGIAAHMGRKFEAESAIDRAIELVGILYRWEAELLERARGHPLFRMHDKPVQVNVGRINAGEWPAAVAARAVVEGGVGFLPGTSIEEVKAELARRIEREGGEWLRSHHVLEFPGLHNEAFETPPDAPVVAAFQGALRAGGLEARPTGWRASCDGRLFSKVGRMDTIVFGAGDLGLAHSQTEALDLREMAAAAGVLARLVARWCGAESELAQ